MEISELIENLYEDLNGEIVEVGCIEDDLYLVIECDNWKHDHESKQFKIRCRGAVDWNVTIAPCGWLNFKNEHPLLLQYNEKHADLNFSTAPTQPFETMGRLFETHFSVFNSAEPPYKFINVNSTMLARGFGLIAKGPVSLIKKYQDAISDLLETNITPSYTPKSRKNILLLETRFVICDSIEFVA